MIVVIVIIQIDLCLQRPRQQRIYSRSSFRVRESTLAVSEHPLAKEMSAVHCYTESCSALRRAQIHTAETSPRAVQVCVVLKDVTAILCREALRDAYIVSRQPMYMYISYRYLRQIQQTFIAALPRSSTHQRYQLRGNAWSCAHSSIATCVCSSRNRMCTAAQKKADRGRADRCNVIRRVQILYIERSARRAKRVYIMLLPPRQQDSES
ncbi:unnamed protein product [Trichogramma brassicae]|uniref:Uncharacterized protein n=1 Tax=Trichogramma brassicae TaxID=86971 RepID=A0A6H5I7A7_9HYME|nr:unnamed protein product [Trichogramma brassicae]